MKDEELGQFIRAKRRSSDIVDSYCKTIAQQKLARVEMTEFESYLTRTIAQNYATLKHPETPFATPSIQQ